jgi:hypothetical protein
MARDEDFACGFHQNKTSVVRAGLAERAWTT